MGKEKQKGPKGVQNQHLHARVSYLHQACTYLATQTSNTDKPDSFSQPILEEIEIQLPPEEPGKHLSSESVKGQLSVTGLPLRLNAHLRSVAQKSQIRLHTNIKHTICKRCNNALLENTGSCTKRVENLSRGGKKPWADVLVVECLNCHCVKRFPIGAKRQPRKAERAKKVVEGIGGADAKGDEAALG